MKSFSILTVVPFLALSALAQTTTFPQPQPPLYQVKQFLALTDAQVAAILKNNTDYNNFSFQQQQTIRNAHAEIAVETAKDQLDPLSIGVLYAGIESACRDLRNRVAAVQQQNVALLTDVQKAKLNVLYDAMKLAPTIAEAGNAHLLASAGSPPYIFTGGSAGIISGILGVPSVPGCVSIPTLAFRSGDFSSILPPSAADPGVNSGSSPTRVVNPWFDRTDFVRILGPDNAKTTPESHK